MKTHLPYEEDIENTKTNVKQHTTESDIEATVQLIVAFHIVTGANYKMRLTIPYCLTSLNSRTITLTLH